MTVPTQFTVRDLNRNPRKVLDAVDRLGQVEIRTRDGKVYSLASKPEPRKKIVLPDFIGRMKAAGMKPISKEQSEAWDRMIAGEDL